MRFIARILLGGLDQLTTPPQFSGDQVYYASNRLAIQLPTIYDYDIFILNPDDYVAWGTQSLIEKKSEIKDFIESGGVLVIILGKYMEVRDSRYTDIDYLSNFLPILVDMTSREGETVIQLLKNEFHTTFHNFGSQMSWKSHFKQIDDNFVVLATNRAGNCISALYNYGKGKIVFLPNLKTKLTKEYVWAIVSDAKKISSVEEVIRKPIWVTNYQFGDENELLEQVRKTDARLDLYEHRKKLLYARDKSLVNAVADFFRHLNLNVEIKEKDGREDIEIKLPTMTGIVEVTGTKGYVDVDKLRQLLDWYTSRMETEEIKGILVANAFLDEEPARRKAPFSGKAITLAKNNGFCLLTSSQLFEWYKKLEINAIEKNTIIQQICSTNGELEVQ